MPHRNPTRVLMMTRYELERFSPPQASMLISISDSPGDPAHVSVENWERVYFHSFVDTSYDEETIEGFGKEYDHVFADAITPEKALKLINDIEAMMELQPELIVVECDAGPGRSASIAQYLMKRYSCECDQEITDVNMAVLRLLNHDQTLRHAIESARSGEMDHQKYGGDPQPAPPQGFLSRLLGLFGVEQNPR